MATTNAYVTQLAGWIGEALSASESLFDQFSTESLGLQLPDAVLNDPNVSAAVQHAKVAAQNIGKATTDLLAAGAGGGQADLLVKFSAYAAALIDYFAGLGQIATRMQAAITPATVPDPGARAAASNLAASLAKRLAELTIASVLTLQAAPIAFALKLMGLFRWSAHPADPANPLSRASVDMGLELGRLKDLIRDPATHFRQSLHWGAPDFDPTSFFRLYKGMFHPEASIAFATINGDPALRHGSLQIRRQSAVNPPGIEMKFMALPPPIDARTQITDEWGVGLKTAVAVDGGATLTLQAPLTARLGVQAGSASGQLLLYADRNPDARPFGILPADLINLTANNVQFGLGFDASWNAATSSASLSPLISADLSGVQLGLGSDGADGFIAQLLGGSSVQGQFDLGLQWDGAQGLQIKASGGTEIALPVHKSVGPIDLSTVYIVLGIQSDGTLSLETSVALSAELGPLTAMVDHLGALIELRFADAADAKFGPFDLDLAFKPPSGVGLSLDVGIAQGAGFLFFDSNRQEYAGALEIDFADIVTVKAIGLITTKMPDGSKGFSLLIILSAEFGSGIQLGFGFTLLAVGGLFGLNRAVAFQPLMDGLRTDAIESVLFPTDIVANASQIVSDLRALFPPRQDTFLVGPMAKLGWGEPTLVSLSLGIIIEIPPGDAAILGVLKVALPAEELAILMLQVNFAGVLEFDKSRFYFYATLFDSHVLFITLDGDIGTLMAFSGDANFVLSVGGFHPQFNPPPLPFPTPKRIDINIINESYARIRADGYFAVTTNTVQFGTHSDFFFGFSALSVEGHSGFDGLIQFSPFHFSVSVSTDFSVNVFGIGVYGIGLDLLLEGPTPWHAHGTASLSFFFFSIDIGIDFTWGDSRNTTLPPVQLMPVIAGELGKQSNWRALLPAGSNLLVTLRKLDPSEAAMVLHPVGTLRVSQRALPLDLTLDKEGSQAPSDANRFALSVSGGGLAAVGTPQELFPLAQFKNLSDADKISQAAYTPLDSGMDLSAAGNSYASATAISCNVRYDLTIIDTKLRRISRRFTVFLGSLFNHFLLGSSVARSSLSAYEHLQKQPFTDKVTVAPETFAVVTAAANTIYHPEAAAFTSAAAAHDYLARAVANDPSIEGTLQVVPQFEVAA